MVKEIFEVVSIKEVFDEVACEMVYEVICWAKKKTQIKIGEVEFVQK